MFDPEALFTLLSRDPVLAYSLLAALFLAVVSLATGLARADVAVLLRPGVLLRVALAVALALGLALLGETVTRALDPEADTWSLVGLRRFPLYLVALAYGPSVGLTAALLFAAFETSGGWPGWPEAVLGLELVAIGWLAIYPTPRSDRFAGPFNAVVAYLLAWGTAGLALLEYRTGAVTVAGIWQQHHASWLGLLLSALLLGLIGPRSYRVFFPGSRISPPVAATAAADDDVLPDGAVLERNRVRPDPKLTLPELPERLDRARRSRELDPLAFDGDEEES